MSSEDDAAGVDALEDEAEGVVRVVDLEGDVNVAGDVPEDRDEDVEALVALA